MCWLKRTEPHFDQNYTNTQKTQRDNPSKGQAYTIQFCTEERANKLNQQTCFVWHKFLSFSPYSVLSAYETTENHICEYQNDQLTAVSCNKHATHTHSFALIIFTMAFFSPVFFGFSSSLYSLFLSFFCSHLFCVFFGLRCTFSLRIQLFLHAVQCRLSASVNFVSFRRSVFFDWSIWIYYMFLSPFVINFFLWLL